MKHLLLALLLVSVTTTFTLADSPAQIAADYRKQASQALERLNQSLEKATTPLIAKLVSSGDTDGAKQLTEQLKIKLTGEPVADPQPSAAQLFTMYDEARAKALAPVQKSSIARIDSMLKTAGSKIETVTELGKVRAEIEAGKLGQRLAPAIVPQLWTYHMKPGDNNSLANIELKSNGNFTMSNTAPGKWKRAKGTDTITFADKTM